MSQVQLQGQRRHQQERQRGQQRQPVGRLDRIDAKDTFERRKNEGPGNQSGEEWIKDDQNAPKSPYLTAPSRLW
jgi:hypothetical protein